MNSLPVAFGARFFQQHQLQVVEHTADVSSGMLADVVIAMEAAYPPFNNYDPVHGLVGFDTEFTPRVCEAAGIKCAIVTAPFKSAWAGHESAFLGDGFLNHHFDCIVASGNTLPRRATLKFSDPYTQEVLAAFIGKKGQAMPKDASGVHIGTVESFACGKLYVERTMPEAKKVSEFETIEDLISALRADEVDVAVTCPIAAAKQAMDPNEHEILSTAGGFNEGLAFMCHPAVADKIALLNKGIAKVRSDGSMKEMCEKYPEIKCEFERTFDETIGGVGANPKQSQVTIAMEAAYAPFNYFDPARGLVGFDIELVPLVCDAVGIECAMVTSPWKKAWPGHHKAFMGEGFLNHAYDCTAASGNTPPRRNSLKYSDPYTLAMEGVFVGNQGTELKEDGKDAHIATIEGSSCGKVFVKRTMPKAKVTDFPTAKKAFDALKKGSVNVALTCPLANAQKRMGPGHEVIKTVTGFNDGLAFMCHPGVAPKIASLNEGLAILRENGKLQELCSKYPEIDCDLSGRKFSAAQGGVTGPGLDEIGARSAASDQPWCLIFIAAMTVMFI